MFKKSLRLSLIVVLPMLAALMVTSFVLAHGSSYKVLARIYDCYLQNAESPDTLPCQDLVNMTGTQPIYDWNEVNQRAGGSVANSMAIIPDGHLCSAGREKYYGLDQTRGDWTMTPLTAGAPFTFQWGVTANHQIATFHFFITKTTYNPNVPLKWSDLEEFATFENPTLDTVAGAPLPMYQFPTTLPNKTGRHLIYILWERHDSVEDFYACNDVWFGTAASIPTATAAPACSAPEWTSGTAYNAGATVSHNNKQWISRWTNSEEPSTAPMSSPWKLQLNCTFSGANGAPLPTATFMIVPTSTAGPSPTPCTNCGPTNTPPGPTKTFTPMSTATRTNTPVVTTPTRTNTPNNFTPTRTSTPNNFTPTRTNTPFVATITATAGTGPCTPTSTITAPFAFDGSGTFCWQSSNLGTFINSWNTTSVALNGTNVTNIWVGSGSYPAKIGGFWYVAYNSTSAFGHFEAK